MHIYGSKLNENKSNEKNKLYTYSAEAPITKDAWYFQGMVGRIKTIWFKQFKKDNVVVFNRDAEICTYIYMEANWIKTKIIR